MKTVFIPINQGFVFRYLLQTDIFHSLRNRDLAIVLLVPDPRDEAFAQFLKYPNVKIEKFQVESCNQYLKKHPIERLLKIIRYFTLNSQGNIKTIDDYYRKVYVRDISKDSRLAGKIKLKLLDWTVLLCRRFRLLRQLLLLLEETFFVPQFHRELFKKYNPYLMIAGSMGTIDYDQFLIREAKKHHVRVASVILTWDNTTTRGMPGARPDYVIAWTEVMKRELIELNDISENKIFVGGVAHFDHYYRPESFFSKEELIEMMNLDPGKKIIFFATKSPNTYSGNADVAQAVLEAIRQKKLVEPSQLIVRIHPLSYRRLNGSFLFQSELARFDQLKKNYSELILNRPSLSSNSIDYAMPDNEIRLLATILKESSIMINSFSTMNLEAAIFDKPIINIFFDGPLSHENAKSRFNIQIDRDQTHNQRVLDSGCIKIATNEKELVTAINEGLKNPEIGKEGRNLIRHQECGPFPGYAGQKIGEFLYAVALGNPFKIQEYQKNQLLSDQSIVCQSGLSST